MGGGLGPIDIEIPPLPDFVRASDGGFGRGPLLTVGVNQRWRLAAVGRRRNRRVVGLPERDCDQDHGFDCHTHGLPTPTTSPPASRPCKQQCCQTNDPESLGLVVPKGSKTKLRTPPARLNFVGAPKMFSGSGRFTSVLALSVAIPVHSEFLAFGNPSRTRQLTKSEKLYSKPPFATATASPHRPTFSTRV